MLANEIGRPIHAAGPSLPVRINGLRELPSAGDELLVVQSEARAKEVAEFRKLKAEVVSRAELAPRRGQRRRTSKLVPTILKADSAGSLEAVGEGLRHFPTSRVELKMVRSSVGSINESDIQLAKSVGATVFAFNVPIVSTAATLAAQLQVRLCRHARRTRPFSGELSSMLPIGIFWIRGRSGPARAQHPMRSLT